jgi:uncharacterized protein
MVISHAQPLIYIYTMKIDDDRINTFLEANRCLTLCTATADGVWCANCYFAYNEQKAILVIKSSEDSRHTVQALQNPAVAGTILPDKLETISIKGIQFTAAFKKCADDTEKEIYYKKYPFARAISGDFWLLKLQTVKYTDNTLGFGKKIYWPAE